MKSGGLVPRMSKLTGNMVNGQTLLLYAGVMWRRAKTKNLTIKTSPKKVFDTVSYVFYGFLVNKIIHFHGTSVHEMRPNSPLEMSYLLPSLLATFPTKTSFSYMCQHSHRFAVFILRLFFASFSR